MKRPRKRNYPYLQRRLKTRAQSKLRLFRQATSLAVGLTAFLILFTEEKSQAQETDPTESVVEATETIRELAQSFYSYAPRLAIAALIFLAFWLLSQAAHTLFRKLSRGSQKGASILALAKLFLFFVGLVAALSVAVGDARALLGSLGLIGLALSWALQTPIESFTGWVLNAFRGYYQVGDRIQVGEVFGDVYKIDLLTTTVWEAGGPGKSVTAAQPTGALITFPNSEVLRANITNYTRDFSYVWDEVTFALANESDTAYAVDVIRKKAKEVIGETMTTSSHRYRKLLIRQGLGFDIEEDPQVYLSLSDSWTNYTVRYLVDARSRRKWASLLIEKVGAELNSEKHKGRILSAYPRLEAYIQKTPSSQGVPSE